jgi:hypothetical protein
MSGWNAPAWNDRNGSTYPYHRAEMTPKGGSVSKNQLPRFSFLLWDP